MVDFLTIPDELLHVAEAAYNHYRHHGYEVSVEHREIGFPFTPALVCSRGHETHIVEVVGGMDDARVRRWKTFGISQIRDTRVTFAAPDLDVIGNAGVVLLRQDHLGLLVLNGGAVVEITAAADLAVPMALPDLGDLPNALWPLLGPVYEKLNRGEWRDALAEACSAVETFARNYLVEGTATGRIVVLNGNGTVRALTAAQIRRQTLGQLAENFGRIQNRNHTDSVIANILPAINPERVGLAHHRNDALVEEQLRRNAGNHMHAIIACLEELVPPRRDAA